jgi:hypothetical protein
MVGAGKMQESKPGIIEIDDLPAQGLREGRGTWPMGGIAALVDSARIVQNREEPDDIDVCSGPFGEA